ncbi:hypothetical protein H6S82_18725 [Planktothrix sp. FACHB-1355]|uniref:Uncharacterized protein n=1 Tax=Aerosakkonema funiforme FACHB-1375 TaxID=2949571 RepID=A0A926ZES3_9CYAN|nr:MULTISPECIES: hypothetical protein [Oscillatoriales]MBD2179934.1 hypothetical protein [Aerosakkonema funiforme FACHB-1375]MBD3560868.1 hypothetical protein [Planktothrix sp. FACHB-1355]
MKAFLNILVVALVATAPQLGGCSRASSGNDVGRGNLPAAQAQAKVDEALVPVALPNLAVVSLKNGDKIDGKVAEIDTKSQKLLIQGEKTTPYSLSQVEKIEFSKNAVVYKTDGRQVVRGDGVAAAGVQQIWKPLQLDDFHLQQGKGEVKLKPPVVDKDELKGILAVSKNRSFVVDEIQFDWQNRTMAIKATPY